MLLLSLLGDVCVCVCASVCTLTRLSTVMLTPNVEIVIDDAELKPRLHRHIGEMTPLLCVLQHRAV